MSLHKITSFLNINQLSHLLSKQGIVADLVKLPLAVNSGEVGRLSKADSLNVEEASLHSADKAVGDLLVGRHRWKEFAGFKEFSENGINLRNSKAARFHARFFHPSAFVIASLF